MLRLSTQFHDPSGHAAMDATFREFPKIALIYVVYNIKRAIKQ